jgi:G3E family GTPase
MASSLNFGLFFKGSFEEDPATAIQALMRAVLIRTQFLPTVRHIVGWRGLKQSPAEAEGWTAKIRDHAGVFGLFFMGLEPTPDRATGRFGLCYFPDPAEPLVERCSLKAAAVTQSADYHLRIRDFIQHIEMGELFGVGSLLLSVRQDQRALGLAMHGMSALRTVAREGVRLPRDGQMVQLVAPGGYDQDFPAFEVALGFFEVLAASVTFNLGQAPGSLIEARYPADQRAYDGSGAAFSTDAPDLWDGVLALGYGEGNVNDLAAAVGAAKGAPSAVLKADGPEASPETYRDRLWWRAHQLKDSKSADKNILGVDERPPLIILTGFLGAGKTSFLQRFIEYQTQRHRFVAVIQNEIGAVGLDGKLVDYTVTEIDEGCVCCGLAGNLKGAVQGILADFSPDYVILETSGLANPLNLIDAMAELSELVRLDATVTLVDAVNLEAALASSPIAADQIRAADVIVLNKCDLVDERTLNAVQVRVQAINPGAPLFGTVNGDLNPAFVFDVDERPSPGSVRTAQIPSQIHATHSHSGLWSKTLTLPRPLDRNAFLAAVAALPPSIFRVKGLIDFTDSEQTLLFQYVAGRYELSVFPHPGVSERFLTVIGQGGAVAVFEVV